MMRRAVRLTLLVLFVAATGQTAYLFWVAEQQTSRTSAAMRSFDEAARGAMAAAGELRSAQLAYVAPGQGPGFWFARSHTLQSDIKNRVSALRQQAGSSPAVASLEDALGLLQDFEQMDVRARELARAGDNPAASNLIFADGLDLTRKIAAQVNAARVAELGAGNELLTSLHHREIFSVGAAAAAALLIVILLVPVRESAPAPVPVPVPVQETAAPHIEPEPVVTEPVDTLPIDHDWRTEPEPAPDPPPPPPAPPEPAVDLPAVAHLCTDLAQLTDTHALTDMLGRAATLLDASGIVLWIADPDGRELAPIITHGYSPHVVTRLGVIERDAQNVTAAAFRTSLMQTMASDGLSSGAVAAPLVTAAGCVGVMAAEVGNGGERRESTLAAAGIVAAQLATLVGPPSTRPARAEVG